MAKSGECNDHHTEGGLSRICRKKEECCVLRNEKEESCKLRNEQ
jgi:hypothetical protein